jgi:hypothetical protein
MLSKSRWEELKKQWDDAKASRKRTQGTIVEIFPTPPGMRDMARIYRRGGRPKMLRGNDLLQELARLALESGDQRIAECVRALLKLGIVTVKGQQHAFSTKWHGKHVDSVVQDAQEAAAAKRQEDARALREVLALKKKHRGPGPFSVREACAAIAVKLEIKAATFQGAFERVRNAYKAHVVKQTRG